MKRCLQLPEINLEDVRTASDLFCQMMNAELLSADNLNSLASVLKSAGLLDLCNEVILNASKLKSSTKGNNDFFRCSCGGNVLLDIPVRETTVKCSRTLLNGLFSVTFVLSVVV